MDNQRARRAERFDQLYYIADPPNGHHPALGVHITSADPPVDKSPTNLDEVREAATRLIGGRYLVFIKSVLLLKARGEAILSDFHADLTGAWYSYTMSPNWEINYYPFLERE